MQFEGRFLSSKLGRRIFAVFCFCSLVPLIIMAVIAFTQVESQLKEQGTRNLQQSTKAMGMTIYERMILLGSELQRIGAVLKHSGAGGLKVWDDIDSMFNTVVYFKNSNHVENILYKNNPPPIKIDYTDIAVESQKIAVLLRESPSGTRIYISLPMDKTGSAKEFLVAEVNTSFLWKIGTSNIVPPQTDLLVIDEKKNTIITSLDNPGSFINSIPLNLDASRSRQFEWSVGNKEFFARNWTIFMPSRFFSDNWTVFLIKSKQDIFSSVKPFQRIFPLILILSFFIVVLLSMINIRLILDPLEKMKHGIQRISNHDFENPIEIRSGDEFEAVADTLNSMAKQLDRRFKTIRTISEIDRAILSSLESGLIIHKMLTGMQELLSCNHVSIFMLDVEIPLRARCHAPPVTGISTHTAGEMFFDIQKTLSFLGSSPYMHFRRTDNVPTYLRPFAPDTAQWFILPVFVENQLGATLNLGYDSDEVEFDEDLRQAIQMADHMAVALANSNLIRQLDQLNEGALTALAKTIDAKSPWTAGHSERVSFMSCEMASILGLDKNRMDNLRRAALLHDIGKVGISSMILDKPGSLTDEEYGVIKEHPRMGALILEPIKVYREVVPVVMQHHERFDGKGYPEGLSGENIVFEARILAVADVYDALISGRFYRPGWPRTKVCDHIINSSGAHFDPQVVEAFESLMQN